MSRKIRIALIDSGINPTIRCAKAVVSSYALNKRDMLWEIKPTPLADSYGHGSAVVSIIFSENSNIEIINFQLATDSINIDEEGLLFTLRYIECTYKSECDRCPGTAYNESGDLYGCDEYSKKLSMIRLNNYQLVNNHKLEYFHEKQ